MKYKWYLMKYKYVIM